MAAVLPETFVPFEQDGITFTIRAVDIATFRQMGGFYVWNSGDEANAYTRLQDVQHPALLSGAKEYAYLQRSMAAFPAAAEFARIMGTAGLHVIEVTPLTFGVCTLYVATPLEEP